MLAESSMNSVTSAPAPAQASRAPAKSAATRFGVAIVLPNRRTEGSWRAALVAGLSGATKIAECRIAAARVRAQREASLAGAKVRKVSALSQRICGSGRPLDARHPRSKGRRNGGVHSLHSASSGYIFACLDACAFLDDVSRRDIVACAEPTGLVQKKLGFQTKWLLFAARWVAAAGSEPLPLSQLPLVANVHPVEVCRRSLERFEKTEKSSNLKLQVSQRKVQRSTG